MKPLESYLTHNSGELRVFVKYLLNSPLHSYLTKYRLAFGGITFEFETPEKYAQVCFEKPNHPLGLFQGIQPFENATFIVNIYLRENVAATKGDPLGIFPKSIEEIKQILQGHFQYWYDPTAR